jgi:RNA polymerase sigma factor (sigma-70 family)
MIDDATLLHRFAAERSEEAFTEFVQRHLPFVYSAALRRLGGDSHRAEDVAQSVFCAVARDAHRLAQHPVLAGWLYTATRFAASDVLRAEKRRRVREQEAHTMQENSSDTEAAADWSRLRPVLDAAMDHLSSSDREAVLLRFFQARPFAEIGKTLGLSEEAARKRVDRALEKLRAQLKRHRVASTATALATLLATETISAAPATLAANIAGAAVASGSAAVGAVALMTLTKLQVGIAAAVIVAGGAALVTQQRAIAELRETNVTTQQQMAQVTNEKTALAKARADEELELARLRAEIATLSRRIQDSTPTAPTSATSRTSSSTAIPPSPAAAKSSDPETKARLRRRYDPFLQRYGLTPAQMERFVELKMAIADVQADLQGAMQETGVEGGTAGVEAMRSQLTGPMWNEIRQLLGEEAFAAYGAYESESAFRLAFIEPMLPIFTAANAALAQQQVDGLVRAFEANRRSIRANPTDLGTTGVMDWDGVVAEARGILTPTQLSLFEAHVNRRKSANRMR